MKQLEGLNYVTALDLNIRYYTIRISTARQYKMTMIFTTFFRFR